MESAIQVPSRSASAVGILTLLITNVIPIIGVLAWGWDMLTVILLYWGELFILGGFSCLKLIKIAGTWWNENIRYVAGTTILAGAVYFIFIVLVFGNFLDPGSQVGSSDVYETELSLDWLREVSTRVKEVFMDIRWALTTSVVSHSVSYLLNFLARSEYKTTSQEHVMQRFGWRIIPLHLAILAGCFYAFDGRNATTVGILVLMGVKTIGDLLTHVAEHRTVQETKIT